jgi:hypothetical protein
MQNPWVAFMMQFRTYPILGAEKQQARHMKFADKEAATGILLNTASSAGARIIRYASLALAQPLGEREEYFKAKMENLGYDTVAYLGVAGMTPYLSTIVTQATGHPFGLGENNRPIEGLHTEIPAVNYFLKLMEIHEAAMKTDPETGESVDMKDSDWARIQSVWALGTILFMNILAGIGRTALDAGEDEDYDGPAKEATRHSN